MTDTEDEPRRAAETLPVESTVGSPPSAPSVVPTVTGTSPWYLALGQWYTSPRIPSPPG